MFDMRWFQFSKEVALRQLQFSESVAEFLNPLEYHYSIKPDAITITKKSIKKNKFLLFLTLQRDGKHLIDYDYGKAIESPLVYALAIRMKYLELPRKWLRITNWQLVGDTSLRICAVKHEDTNQTKYKILDTTSGATMKLPAEAIKILPSVVAALKLKRHKSSSKDPNNPFRNFD